MSTDQQAILVRNGDMVSMTLSTAYTGEGDDFGWIIPTPATPLIADVREAGARGEDAFAALDDATAPRFESGGGCFPPGTEVLTVDGPRTIESVGPGAKVLSCDVTTGAWVPAKVLSRQSIPYEGEMVGIRIGSISVRATGNHPFFVVRGDRLASRPRPSDVPAVEQGMTDRGRWVAARDLEVGDVLWTLSGGEATITGLSSRTERVEVYNLDVDGFSTYAVHRTGILVHNKGASEAPATHGSVTVHGRVRLEHFEASVLGASTAHSLLEWLHANGYPVASGHRKVLESYIERQWSFVAVRLNPEQKRRYQHEFLPPLTISYRHDRLLFPLLISSVSTAGTARITLFVVAESTVSSAATPTVSLVYEPSLHRPVNPAHYIDSRIRSSAANGGLTLVVLWKGEIERKVARLWVGPLMKRFFGLGAKVHLTRLEALMGPASMTGDIELKLDATPTEFKVAIKKLSKFSHSEIRAVAAGAGGLVHAGGSLFGATGYAVGAGTRETGALEARDFRLLMSFDASGTARWMTSIATKPAGPEYYALTSDAQRGLLAAGWLAGAETVEFAKGVKVTGTPSGFAGLLVRYDSSGTARWARAIVGEGRSWFPSVATDARANSYAVGHLEGLGRYDFGDGVAATGVSYDDNAVLTKYDSSGRVQWVRTTISGTVSSVYNTVAVDAEGGIYAAGAVWGLEKVGFGRDVSVSGTNAAATGVLVKYDSSGTARWARTLGPGSPTSSFDEVTVDARGNIYIAGSLHGEGTFSFGDGIAATFKGKETVSFLACYDASGAARWIRALPAGKADVSINAIAADPQGVVYVAGSVSGAGIADFGSGIGIPMAAHGSCGVLAKYDASGNPRWVRMITATAGIRFWGVAVGSAGSVYVAGTAAGRGMIDAGGGVRTPNDSDETVGVLASWTSGGDARWIRTLIALAD